MTSPLELSNGQSPLKSQLKSSLKSTLSRRDFLARSGGGIALTLSTPNILSASKSQDAPIIVGEGELQFEVQHNWAKLPDRYSWQTTHNVAVDKSNNLYVIHEGHQDKSDHPSIFVFDSEGRFIRAFGQIFQGGGHGIEVRQEGSEEFLYVCAYQQVKSFAKMTLSGEMVWQQWAPMESGKYHDGENTKPEKVWGRDRFLPTNITFLPDGGFFLADGYGAFLIHRYDKDAKWIGCFGGPGNGEGSFNTPHGLWLDDRNSDEPRLVVTDRAHNTLQFFKLDGTYIQTISGFGLPANADVRGDLLLVPELLGRVSILNSKNEIVVQLGDDSKRIAADTGKKIRSDASQWLPGKFVHPHDACFDQEGNIFVAEWVSTGRITRLKKMT